MCEARLPKDQEKDDSPEKLKEVEAKKSVHEGELHTV
jgi:hypothetical protein